MAASYYPPRARWYSPLLLPWFALQRVLHLEEIRLPRGLSVVQFMLSLVLPGYAFFGNGRRVLGRAFAGAYGISMLLFVIALGRPIGGVAYGVMIATHASSIIFLEGYWLRKGCRFRLRLVLAVLTLLVVWLAVYAPVIDYAERHWCMPLRVRGTVVVVRCGTAPRDIRRGEWILYSMREGGQGNIHQGGAVRVMAGFGWGRVLALPGDRVEFLGKTFVVNGVARPPLPHMPVAGGLVLAEKHWFVWPEFDIYGHGNVSEATISALMMERATVSEAQFIGRPFEHWFWRRQLLP